MALETATNILGLNPSWPTGVDDISDGDNHIRMLKAVMQAAYPVGAVLINSTGSNPGSYIGGTWVQTAQGRAIVGVGDNGETDWLAGDERGSETHTLVADEVPAHSHPINVPETTTTGGEHTHTYSKEGTTTAAPPSGTSRGVASSSASDTATGNSGGHQHTLTIDEFDSGTVGADAPHNNIQPSKAFYVWERTA